MPKARNSGGVTTPRKGTKTKEEEDEKGVELEKGDEEEDDRGGAAALILPVKKIHRGSTSDRHTPKRIAAVSRSTSEPSSSCGFNAGTTTCGGGGGPPSTINSGAGGCRTLDVEHNELMRRFERLRVDMANLEASLWDNRKEVDDALSDARRPHLTDADWDRVVFLRDQMGCDEQRLHTLRTENDEVRYLVTTGDILFKYYNLLENVDHVDNAEDDARSSAERRPEDEKDAVTTANCAQTDDAEAEAEAQAKAKATEEAEADAILRHFRSVRHRNKNPSMRVRGGRRHHRGRYGGGGDAGAGGENGSVSEDRATLLETFMEHVDRNYIRPSAASLSSSSWGDRAGAGRCGHCGSEKRVILMHDGCVFCSECFTQEIILVDHEKPSYKDPPKEIISYAYKRINHFKEWLNQIQGKETTDVPDSVYDSIMLEIRKEKIPNLANLKIAKVKAILKKLKIHRCYDHVPHIIYRLNGIPVPHMSPELEERLCHMFYQIQVPFMRHAPPKRKNFLSYSYVLHKFMQLLEQDQYLPSFPLLKSRIKLHNQDITWKKICDDLNWEFYKSI